MIRRLLHLLRDRGATDYRLAAPIQGYDGVAYDPATGEAVLGHILPDGPRGGPFVAPRGTWTRTETEDRVSYPPAPPDWRRQVIDRWRS